MPKYFKIKKGINLTIPKGAALTIHKNIGKESEIISPAVKRLFENFVPDLTLGTDLSLSISNYTQLYDILNELQDLDAYFDVGIIIAKKHRRKAPRAKDGYVLNILTDLEFNNKKPKGACICWGGTPVGTPTNNRQANLSKPETDYLTFKLNWETGKIVTRKNDTSESALLNWIHPVPTKDTPKYRGQDNSPYYKEVENCYNHNYYFIGVVFRIKDPITKTTYCRTGYSPKCVKVSYDINRDFVKALLVDTGYATSNKEEFN